MFRQHARPGFVPWIAELIARGHLTLASNRSSNIVFQLDVLAMEGIIESTMFCPQCGSTQSDELRYCKTCGANLQALRQLMATRASVETADLMNVEATDVAPTDTERREVAREERRRREIKAGVILASAGIGISILLLVLMGGIIASGRVSEAAAEILARVWIVGILPMLVGAALIFNGIIVSKRGEASRELNAAEGGKELRPPANVAYLEAADTNDLVSKVPFSVTDRTTQHLGQKLANRDE